MHQKHTNEDCRLKNTVYSVHLVYSITPGKNPWWLPDPLNSQIEREAWKYNRLLFQEKKFCLMCNAEAGAGDYLPNNGQLKWTEN